MTKADRDDRLLLGLLFGGLILLLLVAQCDGGNPPDAGADQPFNYFFAKAEELDFDRDRVIKWVQEDVRTLPYRGDLKGPLGALWGGEASPEEKLALANAVLEHCDGAPPVFADFSESERNGAEYQVKVSLRTLTDSASSGSMREDSTLQLYSGHTAALVGDVHSVVVGKSTLDLTLRPYDSDEIHHSVSRNAGGAELVFEVDQPGGGTITVVRELWRSDNTAGPTSAVEGDRHDFVVLPCRVSDYVREKEELRLKEKGREKSKAGKAYLELLDYTLQSDNMLQRIEDWRGVKANFDLPRIHIMSERPQGDSAPVKAFDLRLNHTSFEGERVDAYWGSMVRSFMEAGLEHQYLESITGGPVTSAWQVFNDLRDNYPNSFERRIDLIWRAVQERKQFGVGRTTFTGHASDGESSGVVHVDRIGDSCSVIADVEWTRDFIVMLDELGIGLELGDKDFPKGEVFDVAMQPGEAVAVVEALFRAQGLPADYVLEVEHDPGERLLYPGAHLEFEWTSSSGRLTRQMIDIGTCAGELSYGYTVRSGVLASSGVRKIDAATMNHATIHNPYYRSGENEQTGATSLCLSRAVFNSAQHGSVPFALWSQLPTDAPPSATREIVWKGHIEARGEDAVECNVNGKVERLPLRVLHLVGDDPPVESVTVLNDPSWPLGMADKLKSVRTCVRVRVVDEDGYGISRAQVFTEGNDFGLTRADGTVRLPPKVDGYGVVNFSVTQTLGDEVNVQQVEADLIAPGLQTIELKVDRLRTNVEWISPAVRDRVKDLNVSDQVKRYVNRELDSGRLVVIPDRPLAEGRQPFTGYFAYQPETGYIVGVTEDGLHGAGVGYGDAIRSAGKDLASAGKDQSAMAPIHMMRGALTASWNFSRYRLQGMSTIDAIRRLLDEMDFWEEQTNIFAQVEKVAGSKARDYLAGKVGEASPNVDGDGAKGAFKLGYIGALMFMEKNVE